MTIKYDQIEPEVSKSFENIKKLRGNQIIKRSDTSITLNTDTSGLVWIQKDINSRTYDFYRVEEKHKVTEDKKFFSMNLSDDPSVSFDVPNHVETAILESVAILKKYNKKLLTPGKKM